MKIKRELLEGVMVFLNDVKVKSAKQQRKFAAFSTLLHDEYKAFVVDYKEINDKYTPVDEDGEQIVTQVEGGGYSFEIKPEERKAFETDVVELREEEFVWERTETNKDTYDTIKVIFEELDMELSGGKLRTYDLICTSFGLEEVPV